jgi:hypothetical protein
LDDAQINEINCGTIELCEHKANGDALWSVSLLGRATDNIHAKLAAAAERRRALMAGTSG